MEFPGLGANCALQLCNRLDFLPMKCDACHKTFCNDHFRYNHHGCDGERKKDVQVPTCPLCSAPVPGKRGEAPDIAVSAHIDNDCQADPAKSRRNKVFVNRCSFKECKGKEMVKLICSECTLNYCFKHRHGADHQCEGKKNAIRKRLEEAAVSRANAREEKIKNSSSSVPTSNSSPRGRNVFNEIQGTMSEDEALARALSASMQDEATPNSSQQNRSLNRLQPNRRQQVGGESNNTQKCIIS